MKVKVSIVGFYFEIDVDLKEGATISDAMDAASVASLGTNAEMVFSADAYGFLSMVTVLHKERAKSRNSKRTYDKGTYSFTDDAARGNPALIWQYYIFSKDDQRQEERGSEIPFRKSKTTLQEGDQVIWRLVGICTGPTTQQSSKEYLRSLSS